MQIIQQTSGLIQLFKQGKVFAYPTEAVFGLGCDPGNEEAVLRLLTIKQRPIEKGLILVASDFSQVEKYLKPLTKSQQQFTKPSETSYIFPALESAPAWLRGDFDSLAIRISKQPIVRELCESFGSALVSTSANISGLTPARTVKEVIAQLDNKIDAILEGEVGDLQNPTKIYDSLTGDVIRS